MIVLDTNVVSELMRPRPNGLVHAWLDEQGKTECYLTATTVAEVLFGIERLPAGTRRNHLAKEFSLMLAEDFAGRVLSFDQPATAYYARVAASRQAMGRPVSVADAQIAGICLQHGATLATRNTKDFTDCGLNVIDPWTASAN